MRTSAWFVAMLTRVDAKHWPTSPHKMWQTEEQRQEDEFERMRRMFGGMMAEQDRANAGRPPPTIMREIEK